MTYISDMDHNLDFPFAAVGQSGIVYALFAYEEEADEFLETSSTGASRVIDTSTKPKREPKEGEAWMITEGTGEYASKVPFLALVRGGCFIFVSAYDTPLDDDGLDRLNRGALDGQEWAGYRVYSPEGDD